MNLKYLAAIGVAVLGIAIAGFSFAASQTITLAPGERITTLCTTSLTGVISPQQADLDCATPGPTATPKEEVYH